jgi:hypothetical protein
LSNERPTSCNYQRDLSIDKLSRDKLSRQNWQHVYMTIGKTLLNLNIHSGNVAKISQAASEGVIPDFVGGSSQG